MRPLKFDSSILTTFGVNSVPFGVNILIQGPPGVGKSVLCKNVMMECLANNVHVVYVCLDASPNVIRQKVRDQGLSTQLTKLTFIDGYSWLLNEVSEQQHVPHLSNLSSLSIQLLHALNDTRDTCQIIIFDSISTLFLYNAENEITRFIQVNTVRVRESQTICFWTIEEGIHPPPFYHALHHMIDGIIETRLVEDEDLKRFIRVHTFRGQFHTTRWIPFHIEANGKLAVVTP